MALFIDETELTECAINEADKRKLTAMVEFVSQNIKKHAEEKDIDLLRFLKNKCDDEGLPVETVRMCRAIGMYYFYRNNMMFAVDKLQLAINKAEEIGRKDLVVAYTSELGLVYFYEHEHEIAEMQYKYIEKLLPGIPGLDKKIVHLHYYRYGILHSILHRFELAEEVLEKALSYAEEKADIGYTLMNIGVNYKRQLNFNKALEYYDKALEAFEESDYFSKSMIYNNLAELHKVSGGYDKALAHIDKAFEYLDNKDASRIFTYFTTYTEISVLMGTPEKALDRFWDMLLNVEDYAVHKSYIIENINSLAIAGAENEKMLKKLETVVEKLIKYTSADNLVYKKELGRCLDNIRLQMQEENRPDEKGVLFFEKNNN